MSPPRRRAPLQTKREVPLQSTCAQPHECSRQVRLRVLARVPIFAGLTKEQLAVVDGRMTSLSWAAGDSLYTAGAPADHLYVLASGRVKVFQPQPDGQEVVLDLLTPGNLFGSLDTLGEPVYPETAQALTTTCALRIGPEAFRQILVDFPEVALHVLDDVAERLVDARAGISRHSAGTVAQRVAATLLRLSDTVGQERSDGTLLQIPLSRRDLAGMTGSTPESVSRVMSQLRKAGVIDTGRRWTIVLDRQRLAALAAAR